MKKIVIFGGTFNPIHIGHVEMLSALCEVNNLDKILLMPDKIPPHKICDVLASDIHRLNMCKMIADRFNNVFVSDLELNREGKSYTIDTVKELKALYPNYKLAIAIGGDMLTSFDKWKDYEELLTLCQIICFARIGVNNDLLQSKIEHFKNMGGDILLLDNEISEISSSFLRKNITNREISSKYIDKEILDYIINNNIYGE